MLYHHHNVDRDGVEKPLPKTEEVNKGEAAAPKKRSTKKAKDDSK